MQTFSLMQTTRVGRGGGGGCNMSMRVSQPATNQSLLPEDDYCKLRSQCKLNTVANKARVTNHRSLYLQLDA